MANVTFKIGENVYIQFSGYEPELAGGGNSIRLANIQGAGAMFDSIVDIELVTDGIPGGDNTVWQNCIHGLIAGNDTVEYAGKTYECLFIPDGITSVASRLFSLWFNADDESGEHTVNNIGVISLPATMKHIGYEAFKHVHTFDPEGGLDTIDTLQFDSLERVIFRGTEPLESLGRSAFEGCVSLVSVDFKGKTPKSIGDDVFKDCFKLCTVNFGNNIDLSNNIFTDCVSLYSFNASNSINSIDWLTNDLNSKGLFNGCTSLNRFAFTKNAVFMENSTQSWFSRLMSKDNTYLTDAQAGHLASLDGFKEYIKTLDADSIIREAKPYINKLYEPFDVFVRAYLINQKLATIIQSENGGAFLHKWFTIEDRYIAANSGIPFILVKHLGTVIRLNMYPYPYYNMPTDGANRPYIFVKHKGNIWCLARGGATAAMHSPVTLKRGFGNTGGFDYVDYENPRE